MSPADENNLLRQVVEEGSAVVVPRDKFIFAWARVRVSVHAATDGSKFKVMTASVRETEGFRRGLVIEESLPVYMISLPIPRELEVDIARQGASTVQWSAVLRRSTHPIPCYFLIAPLDGRRDLGITTSVNLRYLTDFSAEDVDFEIDVTGYRALEMTNVEIEFAG